MSLSGSETTNQSPVRVTAHGRLTQKIASSPRSWRETRFLPGSGPRAEGETCRLFDASPNLGPLRSPSPLGAGEAFCSDDRFIHGGSATARGWPTCNGGCGGRYRKRPFGCFVLLHRQRITPPSTERPAARSAPRLRPVVSCSRERAKKNAKKTRQPSTSNTAPAPAASNTGNVSATNKLASQLNKLATPVAGA